MIRIIKPLIAVAAAAIMLGHSVHATDVIESTVLAHDRVANVLVLKDKTIWPLDMLTQPLPEDVSAGDKVEIRYQSNEDDGIQTIHSIVVLDQ